MNSKTISFIFAALIASILLVSVSSAALATLSSQSVQLSLSQPSKTLTITNANETLSSITTLSPIVLSDPAGKTVSISATKSGQTITLNSTADSAIRFGSYSTSFSIFTVNTTNSSINETTNLPVSFVKGFCKAGSAGGNLSLDRVDISTSGDEENEWMPLDEITIDVKVENNGDDDLKDIYVEIGLFNEKGKNVIDDLQFVSGNEEQKLGTLKDGERKTVTFKLKVPANFDFDASSSYKLAIKAYSDKSGESNECIDSSDDLSDKFYEDITIDRQSDEDKFIAFDKIFVLPQEATCGDKVSLSTTVFNVGDSDQDEVTIYLDNKPLGIKLSTSIRNGLDTDETANIVFEFTIPQATKDGNYYLELSADYEDGTSDVATVVPIKVIGCQIAPVQPTTNVTDTTTDVEEQTSKVSFTDKIKSAFSGNGMIWLIAAINVILILAIIFVAIKIARR